MDCTSQPGNVLPEFVTWLTVNSVDVSTIIIALMSTLRSLLMFWPSLIELDFEESQRRVGIGLVISILLFDFMCHIKGYFPPLYYHIIRMDHTEASNHFVSIRRFIIISSTLLFISMRICQRLRIKDHDVIFLCKYELFISAHMGVVGTTLWLYLNKRFKAIRAYTEASKTTSYT